jgi:hypothetical protein
MSLQWPGDYDRSNPKEKNTSKACSLDDLDTLKRTVAHPLFKEFAKAAYAADEGYSIRINPDTKKKEMFVAGTRYISQWVLNVYDGLLHQLDLGDIQILDPFKFQKQNELGKIAETNDVDIVYGHSRGGALAADMPLPRCTQKIGLDAAMMLAANKEMLNLNEGGGINPFGLFDEYIGQTGKNNVTVDFSPWHPHKVWDV